MFPVADKFASVPNVAYNLACYARRLGKKKEAWNFLEKAFDHSADPKQFKIMALEDKYLEPLWVEIQQI